MASSTQISLPNGTKYDQPTGLFINNEFVPASGDEFTVTNPVTEEEVIKLKGASTEDVDKAVAAARKAFEGEWSELAAVDRGVFLYKIAELIDRDRELIAAIDAFDNGKPFSAALGGDLDESYNVFRYYAGAADKITGQTIETSPAKLAYVLQEPLGVCGQIIPWNFPFMMLAWKIAPALACGNTVVLKPAEQTPLSALYFGNLVVEAGLPAGVVNIVPGLGPQTGKAIAGHMGIDKVAFTGSTNTGRAIMKSAANNLKNITLECGGKSPSIVFADAELDQAVKWCHFGIMDNKGELYLQVCTSTSRIYVHESIYDKFLSKFVEVTKENEKIGSPFDEGIWQGPQVSKAQYDKVASYIEEGRKAGARLLYGGSKYGDKGYFLTPTVFADTTEDMKIMKEEIFGPVVSIAKFSTDEEVISKANDTSYGLAAALFTEKVSRAHKVARKLQAGMVWINSSGDSHFGIPFGGYKSSGIGRELGQYALDAYTQSKAVHVNLGIEL
ncbi:aldehyde dehydrogenase [Fusarium albosuccineum]|uniref:aldehyde dehydrogenase (NAD(+)) n=1 Tax=Fusarium albosuccineum TaxID=1237068 RepID=A0A8H4PKU6_9HYPO|nr:aldehyde dehydrogenase [Fusarium albosuccineum]